MQEDLYENLDYVVRLADLPYSVHGICVMDEDGRANIYVNSRDTMERREEAMKHEFMHHGFDDYYLPEKDAERINRARMEDVTVEALKNEDPTGDTILRLHYIKKDDSPGKTQ